MYVRIITLTLHPLPLKSAQSLAKYLSGAKPDFYQALGKALGKEQNANLSTSFPSTSSIIETFLLAHIQNCIKDQLELISSLCNYILYMV